MPEPQRTVNGQWPGLLEPGTLDLNNRPSVPNPDGGTSSVFSMSIGVDGKEYLIPRVSEDGRLLSEDDAVKEFYRTKNHLGAFDSPNNATKYAEALHRQQQSLGEKPKIDSDFLKNMAGIILKMQGGF